MKALLYILLVAFSLPVSAGFGKYPIRWGKVSPSEFTIVPQGKDAGAPAIVLCDFGDIEVTNRTFYTRHTRIKILNEAGLKYASVEIPFQTRNRHDDFYVLKARTLVYENGKVIEYPVEGGQMETVKISERWSIKKFTFPRARPGVIIEFKYTIASLDFATLDTWYFQREIPTLWSELRFKVPDPYVYLVTFRNNRPLAPDEEVAFGSRLQWLYDTRARQRRIELARNKYLLYATAESRYKVWAMNSANKKIIMKNLPGLSWSGNNQPVTEYYPQVHFSLFESSGNLPRSFRPLVLTTHDAYDTRGEWELMNDRMALPGYVHYRMKTWSELNATLLAHERFGKYLITNRGGLRFIDSISGGTANMQARMNAIYGFVKTNFRWNGAFSMYAEQDFDDFLRNRTGPSAEINLMLINLLQRAGIQADPLLIRTADMGMPEKMYPVTGQFNHVIAMAEINGVRYLLDATVDSKDTGMLNRKDIGTQGWIVHPDNPGWIEIFTPEGTPSLTPPVSP
jgi:transglutaminase-like putative cysteine protease